MKSSDRAMTLSTGALPGYDALPYSVGVDELHTFACCFCDKAFSKTSYLSKHKQVFALIIFCIV